MIKRKATLSWRWVLLAVVVFGLVLTAGFLRPQLDPALEPGMIPQAAPSPSSAPPPSPPARAFAAPPSKTPAVAKDLLAMPGAVPVKGSGKFSYATGRSKIFGTGGALRRYRVAVERGSGENVSAFAAQVEATLGDARSWTGDGRLRLQRVSGDDETDFTVYLATRETAGDMCARGGVNIRVGGRPYTSCRATGQAIINLDRWRLSATPYRNAKVPLELYRHYVVNHEVGHELGHGHQNCPKRGGPAPVMVQQTLTLRGCVPYAWPRRAGTDLRGPSM